MLSEANDYEPKQNAGLFHRQYTYIQQKRVQDVPWTLNYDMTLWFLKILSENVQNLTFYPPPFGSRLENGAETAPTLHPGYWGKGGVAMALFGTRYNRQGRIWQKFAPVRYKTGYSNKRFSYIWLHGRHIQIFETYLVVYLASPGPDEHVYMSECLDFCFRTEQSRLGIKQA